MKTSIVHNSKESTPEADSMIQLAINQVKDKSVVTWNGRRAKAETLCINQGHNIYTLDITIRDANNDILAYFCNGQFWSSVSRLLVELK